jgi:hypothetical protein
VEIREELEQDVLLLIDFCKELQLEDIFEKKTVERLTNDLYEYKEESFYSEVDEKPLGTIANVY